MKESNPTETRAATIFEDEQGVIIITFKDCGEIDEFDMTDINLVVRNKSRNKPALKLVIATGNWDMTKKAKEVAEKGDSLTKTRARAIVVSNNIKASLFNFLKTFSEKDYPQQFFNSREEAYNWLLSFREQRLDNLHL